MGHTPGEISECGTCHAPVRWAVSDETGRWSPIDASPASDGNLVLTLKGPPERKALVVSQYDPEQHPARNRYKSHFATCPNAAEHRRGPR